METVKIRRFMDMETRLRSLGTRQRIAVVCCYDDSTSQAVERALSKGFAEMILIGERSKLGLGAAAERFSEHIKHIEASSADEAARIAVSLVRNGQADILMKGLINTDNLLRAVLNKEEGILPAGRTLTHLAVAKIPAYHKLLFFTDAAVIPYPTQEQRLAQVGYTIAACRAFGIKTPRIALTHCSEKVSPKFPHTEGYADIIRQAEQGTWGPAIVDGPLDVRTSCDIEGCAIKGIDSPLVGRADALIFPNIEAGNSFYKTLAFFAGAEIAGTLQGTIRPVVLPSRGDSMLSKYYSMTMAAVCNTFDSTEA